MREIGSEFSLAFSKAALSIRHPDWLPLQYSHAFVFSGRTATETILADIGDAAKTALLPSYCCASMIEPFLAAGIRVDFYQVDILGGKLSIDIPNLDNYHIFLWCNYFGFRHVFPEARLEEFQQKGGIVIEDITHSLLSRQQFHPQSNYLVASLRKWGPLLCGGFCCKKTGTLSHVPTQKPPVGFLSLKQSAMARKETYLAKNDPAQKILFLQEFAESNRWLGQHFSGLSMDDLSLQLLGSWDTEKMRQQRIQNAQSIYRALSNLDSVVPLFDEVSMDCPLFVPILVQPHKRSALRQALTEQNIYCPIHWPQASADCQSSLYATELSLICDQRYSTDDMDCITQLMQRM